MYGVDGCDGSDIRMYGVDEDNRMYGVDGEYFLRTDFIVWRQTNTLAAFSNIKHHLSRIMRKPVFGVF